MTKTSTQKIDEILFIVRVIGVVAVPLLFYLAVRVAL